MLKTFLAATVITLAAGFMTAQAADLADVYQLARRNDPVLQKAAATREAVQQNAPLARSALLPHLNAGASYRKDKSKGTTTEFNAVTGEYVTTPNTTTERTTKGYNIALDQSIFDWSDWLSLGKANLQGAQAKVTYQIAQQDLIIRVSQAYFDVLAAKDTLLAAIANQKSLQKQLQQAQKKYDVGLSAITDVQEVQAAYDQAHAQVITDRQSLMDARDALLAITGVRVGDLKEPVSELPLKKPEPANAQTWIDRAVQGNLSLVSSRMDARIAAKTVDIRQAARYPTLGLQLSHGRNINDTTYGRRPPRSGRSTGNTVSLQFSLPIWSGGAISAQSRQAKYRHVAAEHETQRVARQVKQKTRGAFLGVLSGIAKVKALHEAIVSAKTALRASLSGRKVGTRTTVDVLRARNNLLKARTNYAQARYQYLIDGLTLKQAAGTLSAQDLVSINQYLTQQQSMPDKTINRNTTPSNGGGSSS